MYKRVTNQQDGLTPSCRGKASNNTELKHRSSTVSSVYCRHCFRLQRDDNTQTSAKKLTIIPTPPSWTCNFMPAGKSCQNQDRISICENPSSPTSQSDNFTKTWLMKSAIEYAFVLHWRKAEKLFLPILPKQSPFHRASPATCWPGTVSCFNHVLQLLPTAWTLCTGCLLTSKHTKRGMTNSQYIKGRGPHLAPTHAFLRQCTYVTEIPLQLIQALRKAFH